MARTIRTSDTLWLTTGPFRGLSADHRVTMESSACCLKFSRKQVLYAENSGREFIWLIHEGYVQQTRRVGSGDQITMAILGPGHIAGLLGFWTESSFLLSARGLTDGIAIGIPMSLAVRLCQESHEFADVIRRQSLARLAAAYEAITVAGFDRVEQRILAALLSVGRQFGSVSETQLSLGIPLTRQDIANMAHTTVETTIRTLRAWEARGWLQGENRMIRLLRLGELRASVMPVFD